MSISLAPLVLALSRETLTDTVDRWVQRKVSGALALPLPCLATLSDTSAQKGSVKTFMSTSTALGSIRAKLPSARGP